MFPNLATPSSSRRPQRTYGRRSNGKRPPPREIYTHSGSDTETEDVNDVDNKESTPAASERSVKRARTSPPGNNEDDSPSSTHGLNVTIQPPSSSSRTSNNGAPSARPSLRLSVGSRETTPSQSQNESHGSTTSVGGTRRPPRRMLSKAQSLAITPKEDTHPSTPRKLRESQSMPITPGSATSARTDTSHPGSPLAGPVAPASPSAGGRAKKTYGRQRSIMQSEMTVDSAPRESYSELRKRFEVDNDLGDGIGGSGNLLAELQLARAPEPISDMRSKGESKRFTDEISYLLGGITDASSAQLKRNSSIDVLRNMQDDGWVAKLELHGETERIFGALCHASGDDEVMQCVVLLFLAILASRQGLTTLLQADASTVTTVVASNLNVKNGPLDVEYKGKVTNAIQQLRTIANALDEDRETSTRGAASAILSQMCRDSVWTPMENDMMSRRVASHTLRCLSEELRPLSDRLKLYAKGLDIMPKEGGLDMWFIQDCLQALSSIAILSAEERARLAEESQGIQDIMRGIVVMSLMAMEGDQPMALQEQAARGVVLALEFIASLASLPAMSPILSSAHELVGFVPCLSRILVERQQIASFTKRSISETEDPAAARMEFSINTDDIPYFILAILGQMVDADAGAASTIASTVVATCGKRACALCCRCNGERLATALTRMYIEAAKAVEAVKTAEAEKMDEADNTDEPSEAFKSYLSGYLAFLITELWRLAPTSRPLIRPSLPGVTLHAQLQGLLTDISELKKYRETAHGKMREILESAAVDEGGGVRANTPGAEDNDKLRDAVEFLESELDALEKFEK